MKVVVCVRFSCAASGSVPFKMTLLIAEFAIINITRRSLCSLFCDLWVFWRTAFVFGVETGVCKPVSFRRQTGKPG
jgi:hypothetical protein